MSEPHDRFYTTSRDFTSRRHDLDQLDIKLGVMAVALSTVAGGTVTHDRVVLCVNGSGNWGSCSS